VYLRKTKIMIVLTLTICGLLANLFYWWLYLFCSPSSLEIYGINFLYATKHYGWTVGFVLTALAFVSTLYWKLGKSLSRATLVVMSSMVFISCMKWEILWWYERWSEPHAMMTWVGFPPWWLSLIETFIFISAIWISYYYIPVIRHSKDILGYVVYMFLCIAIIPIHWLLMHSDTGLIIFCVWLLISFGVTGWLVYNVRKKVKT